MEAPKSALSRQNKRRKWLWILIAIAVVIVLIVIIVPTATILGGRHHPKGLDSSVLLPLYVYPLADAWDPLYRALNATSPLNYTVIINPDSGPGNGSKPNDDFLPAIQRLNTYPNARTVGYVPTNYGKRPIDEVIQDVSTYSGWATNATGIAMHGIFFDEAPHEYSADVADYMRRANDAVLSASGIQGNKTIIHNPGTIPDQGLGLNSTDITVVFEQSYNKFKSQQSALSDLSGARSSYSYMVHSVPSSTNLGDLIDMMSQHAQYLFVTNRDSAYYEGFGSDWRDFVSMVPT